MKPETKARIAAVKKRQDEAKAEWAALDLGASTVASLKKRVETIEKMLGLKTE